MRKLTRMNSLSGIREVAKRAGVSLGTVSNVLNRPEIVALETRQRVQHAIDEIGFVRNGSARQLRVGTSQRIGLIVLDVANPFFTEVARGVEDLANQAGYIVFFFSSRRRHTRSTRDWSSDVCSSDLAVFANGKDSCGLPAP